jgi:uncharacterized protein (TIGR02268 family)
MLPPSSPSLLVLVLLQGAPGAKPSSVIACEDNPRIELSQEPAAVVREICVSPGIMTGFLFDGPFSVELQDEVRFVEVLRGRSGISLVPPRDMVPGERLRLTARLGEGESQRSVTFMLVAQPGQATRQVEVYRDRRTRESYEQEIEQERAKNQKLREENQQLRTRLLGSGDLRGLFLAGALESWGVKVREFPQREETGQQSSHALSFILGYSYKSVRSVAVGVVIRNLGTEPWIPKGASLKTRTGEMVDGLKLGPADAIAPQQEGRVVVERDAAAGDLRGEFTLLLWDAGERTISIPHVSFP